MGHCRTHSIQPFALQSRLWSPGRQVSLQCGVEEALANVSEPNRCEYVAWLVTPAACTPELAALARRQHEEAERELAAVHDEL